MFEYHLFVVEESESREIHLARKFTIISILLPRSEIQRTEMFYHFDAPKSVLPNILNFFVKFKSRAYFYSFLKKNSCKFISL